MSVYKIKLKFVSKVYIAGTISICTNNLFSAEKRKYHLGWKIFDLKKNTFLFKYLEKNIFIEWNKNAQIQHG